MAWDKFSKHKQPDKKKLEHGLKMRYRIYGIYLVKHKENDQMCQDNNKIHSEHENEPLIFYGKFIFINKINKSSTDVKFSNINFYLECLYSI